MGVSKNGAVTAVCPCVEGEAIGSGLHTIPQTQRFKDFCMNYKTCERQNFKTIKKKYKRILSSPWSKETFLKT